MIDRNHKLPVTQQGKRLKVSRGSMYYLPKPVSADDLALMLSIDELHLTHPLMNACVEIEALASQPGTSKAAPGDKIYPYLLRKLAIVRAQSSLGIGHRLHSNDAVEVIEEAFSRFGLPEIVNTNQGSQFTASDFTEAVLNKGCKLSMDG